MKIGIGIIWHVVIDNYIDLFNINSSSENIGADHDSVLHFFELFVPLDSRLKNTFRIVPNPCESQRKEIGYQLKFC